MNDNYPDDIRDFDDHPGSPFYDDSGFEAAVIHKCQELEECEVKVAEIVAEISNAKYDALTKEVYSSFADNKLALSLIDAFHDAEPQLFQEAIINNKELLNDASVCIIDEAVYSYAEDLVLKEGR